MYYLQSRYYDPAIGRFLNADSYTSTRQGALGHNMYAYCGNKPVIRKDIDGKAYETIFDVASLGASIIEVAINPSDVWAWAGLVGDAVDLIPFVTGIGEATRAIKTASRLVDATDKVVDTAKAVNKPTSLYGSYEILYKSGKNYVGKGSFDRAITSAIQHAKPNELNNQMGDVVTSIRWRAAKR